MRAPHAERRAGAERSADQLARGLPQLQYEVWQIPAIDAEAWDAVKIIKPRIAEVEREEAGNVVAFPRAKPA